MSSGGVSASRRRNDSPGLRSNTGATALRLAEERRKADEAKKKADADKKKAAEKCIYGIPQGVFVLFLGPVVPASAAGMCMKVSSLIPGLNQTHCRATAVVLAVYISFFILYSGYKKASPTDHGLSTFKGWLDFTETMKIFGEFGSFQSNRQLNKVAALAGFTCCGLASLPGQIFWKGWADERQYVLKSGVISLCLHMCYSIASFYGFNPIKMIQGKGKSMKFEQLALVCGSCSLTAFVWCAFRFGVLEFLGFNASYDRKTLAFACACGLVHYYSMETRTGSPKDLPVRPWGYVAFIVPALAVALWALSR